MAYVHGKGAAVLANQYDLSAYLNSFDLGNTVEVAETTCFGDSAKEYIAGLRDGSVSLGGFFDGAASAVDAVLNAALAASTTPIVSILPQGAATVGNRAFTGLGHETNYAIQGGVGDAVAIAAEFQPSAGMWGGLLLANLTARTTGENVASQDNAAGTTAGYAASLHVTAFSGTGCIWKIQHSTDNSSWSDLATFTSIAGLTSEHLTGTGTVNRYVRAVLTADPSFTSVTAIVVFARK